MRSWPTSGRGNSQTTGIETRVVDPASSRSATSPDAPDEAGRVTWRNLRREAADRLEASLGGSRTQEARWLVERVSGYSSTELILNETEYVSARSVSFFDGLLVRRCSGEPLQYVLGRWSFRSLELVVNPSVLIPRPETEMVAGLAVEAAAAAVQKLSSTRVAVGPPEHRVVAVDLGTGSGAIALSIVVEVPGVFVWGTDASPAALVTARANLAGLGREATRAMMSEGSWFHALPSDLQGSIDVLVSNPPYVAESARSGMSRDVLDFEPHAALFAEHDGTADLAHIIMNAPVWMRAGGTLVLEMSPEQTEWASRRMAEVGLVEICVHSDFADRPRAVVGKKPA